MKIVNFETANGVRMGVVDGDNVVDVSGGRRQRCPTNSALSAPRNGDIKTLADSRPRRRPRPAARSTGLKFALPVANPGKIICLGLNYLDHVKEGPQKDNIPKFQSIFFRVLTVADAASAAADPAEEVDPVRL